MTRFVLDSGALSRLSDRNEWSRALLRRIHVDELPLVPSPVLVESLTGDGRRDAPVNALLKGCEVVELISVRLARRAAHLRTKARRGSAVDALVVAIAEPDGVVLTGDLEDLEALAAYALGVRVQRV